jgi:hypothetical protein
MATNIDNGKDQKMKLQFTIERLEHAEQSGDWHDKPLRWIARCVQDWVYTQKFSTRKEAEFWRKCVRSVSDFHAASRLFQER